MDALYKLCSSDLTYFFVSSLSWRKLLSKMVGNMKWLYMLRNAATWSGCFQSVQTGRYISRLMCKFERNFFFLIKLFNYLLYYFKIILAHPVVTLLSMGKKWRVFVNFAQKKLAVNTSTQKQFCFFWLLPTAMTWNLMLNMSAVSMLGNVKVLAWCSGGLRTSSHTTRKNGTA